MNKNDVLIRELREKVETQRKELGPCKRPKLITDGIFIISKDNNKIININIINDINILIDAVGILVDYITNRKKACELLEIDFNQSELKLSGYTFDEWMTDFKERAKLIKWNKQKQSLNSAVKLLEVLMSEEAKTESEWKDLKKELDL